MNPFVSERRFPQPVDAVFAAFADAERLARWWGPAGFSNSFEQCDFRTGGRWVFTMHGPDGKAYPNDSMFECVEAPQLIVIRHVCAPRYTLRLDLQADDGGCRLRWQQTFDEDAVAAALAHILEPANEQNLDRLQAELEA